MKKFRKIIAILLIISNILLITGCSDNSESAIVYYGVATPPTTLDPQLASSVTELNLVKNLYEGLMRKDSSGNIVPAAATTADKSGKIYTFTISENAFWNDGTKITAEDFMFGIRRALLPETKSPNASSLYIIKNAEAFHKGKKSAEELGVSAPDPKTLIIEVNNENDNLYNVLTLSVAMPCKQKFFNECKGKYGMSKETVLSNGSFKITKWATEDFAMRLYKTSDYKGAFTPKISGIFISKSVDETNLTRLNNNKIDIGEIELSEIKKAQEKNLKTINIPNTVWLLKIGSGYSPAMKNALLSSVIVYKDDFNDLPEGIIPAKNIYPEVFQIKENAKWYNIDYAKNIYKSEIESFSGSMLPESTLYYEDKHGISELLKTVAGHWQQNLGAYINISGLNNATQVRLKESDYSLTVYSEEIMTADLNKYADFFNIDNPLNLSDKIEKGNIFPLAYSGTVLAYTDSLHNLDKNSTTDLIDFSVITKIQ